MVSVRPPRTLSLTQFCWSRGKEQDENMDHRECRSATCSKTGDAHHRRQHPYLVRDRALLTHDEPGLALEGRSFSIQQRRAANKGPYHSVQRGNPSLQSLLHGRTLLSPPLGMQLSPLTFLEVHLIPASTLNGVEKQCDLCGQRSRQDPEPRPRVEDDRTDRLVLFLLRLYRGTVPKQTVLQSSLQYRQQCHY